MSSPQYTAMHEYGHLKEFSTQNTSAMGVNTKAIPADVKNAFVAAQRFAATQTSNSNNSMSEYGRENAHEAYAEAYTEIMANPATENKTAQIYDRVFNWTGTHAAGTTGATISPGTITIPDQQIMANMSGKELNKDHSPAP
jgi:glutamate/tyrosine decarboxylase-like PLP-dependent enzyme